MTTCHLCGKETDLPCGPRDSEVCPSCWLAVEGDDWLCTAPDLETALDFLASQKEEEKTLLEILEMCP